MLGGSEKKIIIISKREICKESIFFFLSQKENPCGVQFVSSFYRRVEEEKRRGFGGTGIRKRQVAVHFTVD